MGIFFVGIIGLIVSVIILLVKVIRKKPKKAILIITGVFLLISLGGMLKAMNEPAFEVIKGDYDSIMSGSLNGEIIEITGDVEKIEKVDGLYFINLISKDGTYEIIASEDTPGKFPREGDNRIKVYVNTDWSPVNNDFIWIYAVIFPD